MKNGFFMTIATNMNSEHQGDESTTCGRWFPPLLLLFAILSRHPYLFLYPFPGAPMAGRFFLIDTSVISALAIAMVLTSNWTNFFDHTSIPRKLFQFSLFTVFSICVIQFFLIQNYTFRELAFNLVWFALPLAVFFRGKEFKRLVVPYFALFWLFNAIYAIQELWRSGEEIGIPANRNWHATFIITTTPFFLLIAYRLLSRKNIGFKTILAILSIPTVFSIIVLYRCQSRGANLALVATLMIAGASYVLNESLLSPSALKKCCLWIPVSLLPIIAIAILFFGDTIATVIMRDVRIPLWGGAVDLFAHHPWFGVGSASYEAHYVYHIPLAKFLRSWYYTERSDNPHSHFLYMLGSLGIIGFIAALYLWLQPIIHCLKRFGHLDFQTKLTLFVFIALTLHSMVDIIMSRWPTIYLALILLGVLWNESFTSKKTAPFKSSPPITSPPFAIISKTIIFLGATTILIYAGFMLYENAKGSQSARYAAMAFENGYFAIAQQKYEKAVKTECLPIYTYQAGMFSLLYMRDHYLALKYFKHLQTLPGTIIVHSNAHIADCLIHLNRKKEALSYLREELKIYPVSLVALYNTLRLEKKLGLTKQAETTANRLFETLKFKGLNLKDLKTILKNPKLDGRYYLLKKNGVSRQ